MANRNPSPNRPPDLRGLASRQLVDPADLPTQEDPILRGWTPETAEIELLPESDDIYPAIGTVPIGRRPPIPILTTEQLAAERRSAKWVGNVVLVAIALGLLGGVGFAIAAVWVLEPFETEQWLADMKAWATELTEPVPATDYHEDEEGGLTALPEPTPGLDPAAPAAPSLGEVMLGDEAPFEEGDELLDEPAGDEPLDEPADEPVEEALVEEPPPAPVLPRPRPRVPRPAPTASPPPAPTVRPYAERPRPMPEPAPRRSEDGLLLDR